MKCINPIKFPNSHSHVICGQCMPCRITKRNEWHTKLMLEWQTFRQGCFVTLTYDNDHLPEKEKRPGGHLIKKDLQDFLKRFRINYKRKYGYTKLRYFGVGEYGEQGTQRAHFHILLFNVDPLHADYVVNKSWKKGLVQVDLLHKNRLKYTVGYTIKKMTKEDSFKDKRTPEFAIMSKNPGLGHYSLPLIAKRLKKRGLYPSRSLSTYHQWILEKEGHQVQKWDGVFKIGKDYHRLDRYMMVKLAQLVNPEYKEIAEDKEEIFLPKEFKARKNRLQDQSYLDTIKFVVSEEANVEKKKAEKTQRQEKSKRTKI